MGDLLRAPGTADDVDVLIACGRFSEIASLCDELELEAAAAGRLAGFSSLYATHILAHLFNMNLPPARLLWKRIPGSVKDRDAEIAAAWSVGQALWKHDPTGVHAALKGFSWGGRTKPLADALSDKYSKGIMHLLQKSYSSILVAEASALLGLPDTEATHELTQNGWTLDEDSSSFRYTGSAKEPEDSLVLGQVQKLTEYVFHLEQ